MTTENTCPRCNTSFDDKPEYDNSCPTCDLSYQMKSIQLIDSSGDSAYEYIADWTSS